VVVGEISLTYGQVSCIYILFIINIIVVEAVIIGIVTKEVLCIFQKMLLLERRRSGKKMIEDLDATLR